MYKLPKEYWSLDFETSGLPKDDDCSGVDFIEIGYCRVKDGAFVKDSAVQSFAKPSIMPLHPKITEITGITDDMLKDAEPSLAVAEKTFKQIVYSELPIVGYNIINFDRLFLDKYTNLLGWPKIADERYIDAAALFKTYRKAHKNKSTEWELPGAQKKFFTWAKSTLERSWTEDKIKYNLDAAVGYLAIPLFGIEYSRHRAIYDTILTSKVLEILREEMSL